MALTKSQTSDFVAYAGNPDTWVLAARRNLAVAEVLFSRLDALSAVHNRPQHEFSGCFYASYFHAGVAIENAAKATLIRKDHSIVANGSIDRRKFGKTSHALLDLFQLVGEPLIDEERKLVVKLEQHVVWAGKYSVPLKPDVLYDNALMDTLRLSGVDEIGTIKHLVERLLAAA